MLEFIDITKSYKQQKVLKSTNLHIRAGEITVLIGPSGCGKTTCLKLINRLIEPTSGRIIFDGQDISTVDPTTLRRKMGYVIQQTGLFPHMTIEDNIEIIPKLMKITPAQIKARTIELMEMIGLDANRYLHRYPSQLSGGQQQRIGVARAFALDPQIVLMDEPFSALDPISRNQLQDELLVLQESFHKTIVFVTHDMDEAIKIADRICIMNQGSILQFDTPEMILKHPNNDFVRNFVGTKRIWNMPHLIKASDIMLSNPVVVGPNTNIVRAIEIMVMKKVDSLIIADKSNLLLGVLPAIDISRKLSEQTKVCEIMKKDFAKVSPDDNISQLFKLVTERNLSVLPVVDAHDKLLGLITKGSLVSVLSKQYMLEEVQA